jgi:hypothetical protein
MNKSHILGFAALMMGAQSKWKEDILAEWEKSKNYPRKKKKSQKTSSIGLEFRLLGSV